MEVPAFSFQSRWSGPGIQRQKQEMMEMQVPGKEREGAIPGR